MQTAFIFFSFVAFSTGAVASKRLSSARSSSVVRPFEVLLVTFLLVVFAAIRPHQHNALFHASAVSAMLMIGAVVARITIVNDGRVTAGTREFEDLAADTGPASLWARWLNFSRAVVDYEFRIFLVAVYILIIGPFAIIFRLLQASPSSPANSSNWIARTDTPSLDAARRPF